MFKNKVDNELITKNIIEGTWKTMISMVLESIGTITTTI